MNPRSSSFRDNSLDNIRFILIFSVVFAHLLEVCAPFAGRGLIYKCIYVFHMPAFLFLFGYNARFSPKRILFRWCIPYVIFQWAYIAFSRFVLKSSTAFQLTTPYWLLWYMLVCIYDQLLLPLLDTDNKGRQLFTVLWAFVLSLLIGYAKSVGYPLSLSRFFVFLPWFLMGRFCRRNDLIEWLAQRPERRLLILLGAAAVLALLFPFVGALPDGLLYGSYPYASCKGTVWMRLAASVMAFAVILVLCVGLRPYLGRKGFIITHIGQNTWPVFLLHGFAVKAAPVFFPALLRSPWRVLLLTCGILVLAGNKFCSRAVSFVSFSWLERFAEKQNAGKTAGG